MRRLTLFLALALASSAVAHSHSRSDASFGDRCSSSNFHFGNGDSFVEEQVIDAGALRSLKATATHAPITVQGGSGAGYTIKVCKAAESQSDLSQIRVTLENGELKASGPADRRWLATYLITMPRGGAIDVSSTNGPIALRDLDGRVEAHAQNGPLSLRNVQGSVNVETHNGPITLDGGSGSMKIRGNNGPLTVRLDGAAWNGDLDAATNNGPLSVQIPGNYGSSVVVESNGRGPISCDVEGCGQTGGWNDDAGPWGGRPRKIELGRGTANVHLSTVNGPVSIRNK